jgi:hypothetical protein
MIERDRRALQIGDIMLNDSFVIAHVYISAHATVRIEAEMCYMCAAYKYTSGLWEHLSHEQQRDKTR